MRAQGEGPDVSLVCWGSPHMELASGAFSRDKAGAAAQEKASVFTSLSKQFQSATIVVTYTRHSVDLSDLTFFSGYAFFDIGVSVPEQGGVQYVPRYSTGERLLTW